ncbi:hypothetical protein [Clostridium sp. DJ247]|nr:hypothetical protein [Clostridium sp. DJ247]
MIVNPDTSIKFLAWDFGGIKAGGVLDGTLDCNVPLTSPTGDQH